MHHIDADQTYREKAKQKLLKNATSHIEQILEAASHKTAAVQPPTYASNCGSLEHNQERDR